MNLDRFLENFTSWAVGQPNIEGVALVGSHAREEANENSDVDLMILTTNAQRYLDNKEWLTLFGEIERSQYEKWGTVETLRAFYRTGAEIEYNFAAPSWAAVPVDSGTNDVVSNGMKILFDPKRKFEMLLKNLRHNQTGK